MKNRKHRLFAWSGRICVWKLRNRGCFAQKWWLQRQQFWKGASISCGFFPCKGPSSGPKKIIFLYFQTSSIKKFESFVLGQKQGYLNLKNWFCCFFSGWTIAPAPAGAAPGHRTIVKGQGACRGFFRQRRAEEGRHGKPQAPEPQIPQGGPPGQIVLHQIT